jgi:hypothetical protein
LITDVKLWNVFLLEETKADGMLPDAAHTTQHHQTIVLSGGGREGGRERERKRENQND